MYHQSRTTSPPTIPEPESETDHGQEENLRRENRSTVVQAIYTLTQTYIRCRRLHALYSFSTIADSESQNIKSIQSEYDIEKLKYNKQNSFKNKKRVTMDNKVSTVTPLSITFSVTIQQPQPSLPIYSRNRNSLQQKFSNDPLIQIQRQYQLLL